MTDLTSRRIGGRFAPRGRAICKRVPECENFDDSGVMRIYGDKTIEGESQVARSISKPVHVQPPCSRLARLVQGGQMDQNSNYITIEFNLRVSVKNYRVVLGMKRSWIVAIVVGVIQLIVWAFKGHHL